MVALEEQTCRDSKLKDIIDKLSVYPKDFTDAIKKDLISEFIGIYTYSTDSNCDKKKKCDFRHKYSLIFGKLCEMKAQDKEIEYIAINLEKLYEQYDDDDPVRENIFKLKDHIELEIARISYIENIERQINNTKEASVYQINQISKKINNISMLTDSANKKMEKVDKKAKRIGNKLDNMQKESITILGIFASILLAFVGGMAFSTSILENMHKVNIYKVAFVCSIMGLIIVNAIYILTDFILRISSKINSKNTYPEGMKIFTIIMIVLICLIVFAWIVDFKYLVLLLQDRLYSK